jgi:Transcriptional regulator, AbiEi antitoxin
MPDERRFTHLLCGQLHARRDESDDEAIAALASDQHGVVARHQLLEMGVSRRAIEHRVACGRLRPLHRGVYAVGHDSLPRRGRVAAAVLAVRPRRAPVAPAIADPLVPAAAASHLTAAGLWGLTGDGRGLIHVTSQDGRRRLRAVAHHRAILPLDELAVLDGIPVTALARTLLDLSAVIDARSLRRIAKEASAAGSCVTARSRSCLPATREGPDGAAWPISAASGSSAQASRAAISRTGSSRSAATAACRLRRPTSWSRSGESCSRWTASGATSASRSRWTATGATARGLRSRTTAPATGSSQPRVGSSCASLTGSSSADPGPSRASCARPSHDERAVDHRGGG